MESKIEMNKQPTINIGLLGHVANGKSSLVRTLTGERTSRGDSRCLKRGGENREMTVQIGYSNAKIYQCQLCPKPGCHTSIESSKPTPACETCHSKENMTCILHISFVDSPGHRYLMQNMMSGAAVMDAIILVIDSSCEKAQVQTMEHLTAAEIIGIDQCIAIAQNKIDLIKTKEQLLTNHKLIKDIVQNTFAEKAPIIPTCLSPIKQLNKDLILQSIVERAVPNPHLHYQDYPFFMYCVRSFDINKPGPATGLKGGVIGGTIMVGKLKIGDIIEILPGSHSRPLRTRVTSLYTGKTPLTEAGPGGLIAVGTTLDPTLTRSDAMVGMCAGHPDTLPRPVSVVDLKFYLLRQSIGHDAELQVKMTKPKVGDKLQLAIGAANRTIEIAEKTNNVYRCNLDTPTCIIPGQTMPLSRVVDKAPVIIGKAELAVGNTQPNVIIKTQASSQNLEQLYQSLVEKLEFEQEERKDLKIVTPRLGKEGGAKLIWTNFSIACQSINRSIEMVRTFFSEELGTQVTVNISDQLVIHGRNRYTSRTIQGILVKYISGYVKCPSCGSLRTTLARTNRYAKLSCQDCGSEFLR